MADEMALFDGHGCASVVKRRHAGRPYGRGGFAHPPPFKDFVQNLRRLFTGHAAINGGPLRAKRYDPRFS